MGPCPALPGCPQVLGIGSWGHSRGLRTPPPPTHTPCLVTTPPHSQSLQFQPGQQTDLSLPLSTLTLVFEVGVPAWSPKKPPPKRIPTSSWRGWQGTGDASGCYGIGEADETPIGFPGGLVSGGLIPKLQAPSFLVEIEDMNKGTRGTRLLSSWDNAICGLVVFRHLSQGDSDFFLLIVWKLLQSLR